MAGTNEFLTFASNSPTSIDSIVTYTASATRKAGNVAGVASSALMNRAMRQGANMASALGAVILQTTDLSALDDGNISVLRDTLIAAIRAAAAPTVAVHTATGTFTVPDGVYNIRVRGWGCGGGGGGAQGGGAAGGGAAGGYSEGVFEVLPGDSISITIGAAGTAGSSSGGSSGANTGGTGGDVEVLNSTHAADYIFIPGGPGGVGTMTSGSGNGGTAPTPDPNGYLQIKGGEGESGMTTSPARGGKGGDSPMGGQGGVYRSTTPLAGTFPGGGGAGGNGTQSGAAGALGFVIIEY